MTDFIIILVGTIILFGLGVFWVWNNLVHQIKKLKQLQTKLNEILTHRLDTIPYLVESYRLVENQANRALDQLIIQRTVTREEKKFEERFKKEKALGAQLNDFFEATKQNGRLQKDIGWLEARTEIQKIGETIEEHFINYRDLRLYVTDKMQTFPYVIFQRLLKNVTS